MLDALNGDEDDSGEYENGDGALGFMGNAVWGEITINGASGSVSLGVNDLNNVELDIGSQSITYNGWACVGLWGWCY